MKTTYHFLVRICLMALVACSDPVDNEPTPDDPTPQGGDYLVFTEFTRVDGPLPDAPEREMEFDFKDSIYVAKGDDYLGSVSVKTDPQESVLGFYIALTGSADTYYYDVPATPWMSTDSIAGAGIGVNPPDDAGVKFPFSTEIYIVPYGASGPLKKTVGVLTAEESVINPDDPPTMEDIAEKLKTIVYSDGVPQEWDWQYNIIFSYSDEDWVEIVVRKGLEQVYDDYNWEAAPPAELDGCCTPDGLSHTAGTYMGIYGQCVTLRNPDGSYQYVNPYLTTLFYSNQYIRDFDYLEFPGGGTTFLRELKSRTRNIDPRASNFCDEQPAYRQTEVHQFSNGDYTYDPASRMINFNIMAGTPPTGGWQMPSGEILALTDHQLVINVGREQKIETVYSKGRWVERRWGWIH